MKDPHVGGAIARRQVDNLGHDVESSAKSILWTSQITELIRNLIQYFGIQFTDSDCGQFVILRVVSRYVELSRI